MNYKNLMQKRGKKTEKKEHGPNTNKDGEQEYDNLIDYFKHNRLDLLLLILSLFTLAFVIFGGIYMYNIISEFNKSNMNKTQYSQVNRTISIATSELVSSSTSDVETLTNTLNKISEWATNSNYTESVINATLANAFVPALNEGIKKFSTGCKQSNILDLILDVSKKLVEYDNSTLFVCQPHFTLKVAQECFSESSKTSTKAIDLFIDSIKHQEKCKQNSFKILLKNSRNTKKFAIEDANIILKLLLQDEYFYNNENTCAIANDFADIAEDWDETTKSLMCSLYKKNNCSVFKDLDFENVCSRAEEL